MIPRVKYAFGNCSAHGLQNVSMQFTWTCDPYCLTLAFVKDTTSCKTLQTITWTLSRLSAGTLIVNGVPLCAVKKSHATSMIPSVSQEKCKHKEKNMSVLENTAQQWTEYTGTKRETYGICVCVLLQVNYIIMNSFHRVKNISAEGFEL